MDTSTKAEWPIRVFPRETTALPRDEGVRFGPPTIWDRKNGVDEVHISTIFTMDKPRAEELAETWDKVASRVKVGGPAYLDPGAEFTPGLYLKHGDVITSRGCPNKCWFCRVWRSEGQQIRELKVQSGYNIRDNNLLACSDEHIEEVFDMLKKQEEKARFTGGLESARLKTWHIERLLDLSPQVVWFSYDKASEWEPLVEASEMILQYRKKLPTWASCYVLIGWPKDTLAEAQERIESVAKLGFRPYAMLYDEGIHWSGFEKKKWKELKREWNEYISIIKKKRELQKYGTCYYRKDRPKKSTVLKPFT